VALLIHEIKISICCDTVTLRGLFREINCKLREGQFLLYKLKRLQKNIERKVEWTAEGAMRGHGRMTENGAAGKTSQRCSREIRRNSEKEKGIPPS